MTLDIRQASLPELMALAPGLRDQDRAELAATSFSDQPSDWLTSFDPAACYQQGYFWHHELVAVCAAQQTHPGHYSLGFVAALSWLAASKPISLHIRHQVKPQLVALGMRRATALSLASHSQAHRWMGFLGMRQEAELKSYGKNGEDFLIFGLNIEQQERA